MSVSGPFIARPIATSLLAFAVVLGGILGYLALPVSSLPQVDFPTIEVTTALPGADPKTMSNLVTASLERQLGQIQALDSLSSTSSFGLSQIRLQFDLTRRIDDAAQDVQAAINAAASNLPRNLPYPPTYAKINPADTPILTLAMSSDTVSLRELSDIADTLISERLSTIAGVGHVSVEGAIKPAIRVEADVSRLSGYGLGMADLTAAIASANVSGAKGSLEGRLQSYTISANDQIDRASGYENIVVANRNGAPVRVKDVATVIEGLENSQVGGWYNGKPAVIVDVLRQPGANVVQTVQRIRAELPRLAKAMPAGADLTIAIDRTETIKASVNDVEMTLAISIGLVVLVVLLFLRSVRATIIAGVALPASIVASFGVMWFSGFGLDNLSLMALTIGTGFVIDDAIVMIENIVRHLEAGTGRLEAASEGAREIGFTVVSLTLSLLAVFIPLLFMAGLVGRMFREFAVTLSIVVLVSAVISLTLTPMMCSRLLSPGRKASEADKPGPVARAISAVVTAYEASLRWVLRHETATLLATLATAGLTIWLYVIVPKGFLPTQDTGLVSGVLQAGADVSFAEMSRIQGDVAALVGKDPDVASVAAVVGVGTLNATPNAANIKIILKPRASRAGDINATIDRLDRALAELPGVRVYLRPVEDVQISTELSPALYQYKLTGVDAAEVNDWAAKLAERLRAAPELRNVATSAAQGGLALDINIDRAMAGRLGVSMQNVTDALNNAFGQRQISTIYGQSNQYRVVLEAMPRFRGSPDRLEAISVPSSQGAQVPLQSFATIRNATAPLAIDHEEQFPSQTISFDLAPGAALSDATSAVAQAEAAIGMPASVSGSYSGDAAEFGRSLAGQPWLILAAIVAIYIVLGVLYESLIHPVTILSTLPSAGIGAVLALRAMGQDLSFVALIGIVLLMGIVKKNAILMIDFAIEAERKHGRSPREAILEAARLRFRPIMMTTLAALFGALPLALSNGTGSELRSPLGITIIGGLLLSQLLTLYSTPVVYLAMERLKTWLTGARVEASRAAAAAATASPAE